MKNILKKIFSFVAISFMTLVCVLTFAACKTPISETTTNTNKLSSSNGGIAAIYDGYLYFINGTKTNDGTSSTGNKRSAICRVKINAETGEINSDTYEVVVSDLVGYEDGSLFFFGDYLYYTTPSTGKNYTGAVLYNKTKFMRYDLVNKKSYEIYTTQKNDSADEITYAYYVTGNNLNLLVYESKSKLLTSIKISENSSTNYVIKNVSDVLFSETFGKAETVNGNVDANSFVFYTKESGTSYQGGAPALYMIAPNAAGESASICLSDQGLEISLEAIQDGRLIYSLGSEIYCTPITANTKSISVNTSVVISRVTYENIIYIVGDDANRTMSILYYESDEVFLVTYQNGVPQSSTQISLLDGYDDFTFIDFVTIEEDIPFDEEDEDEDNEEDDDDEVEEPDDETPNDGEDDADGEDEKDEEPETYKQKFKYLIYIADSKIYKLEIMHEVLDEEFKQSETPKFEISDHTQPICLSKTEVENPNGNLIPKIIGKYIYIFAKELDEKDKKTSNVGIYRADITARDDVDEYAEYVGIKE